MYIDYFLLFIIYSFLGWCIEVIDTKITINKWLNRGFLMGPLCPIYGIGCLLIIFLLQKYYNDPLVLFCMAIIICSVLEYTTSFLMEKLFKLRWWDYSDKKFNINGRICLETMLPFGILGTLVVYIVNPFFTNLINKIPENFLVITTFLLMTFIILDFLISFNVILNLKSITKNLKKDSTEDISKAVRKKIESNLYLYTRLINAFPNIRKIIKENKEKIAKQIEKRKKKIKKLEEKIEKIKSKI